VVTVVAPNGGEVLTIGAQTTLRWTATDDHPLPTVTLDLSRDGGQSYETIAANVPNNGALDWTVPPPQTNSGPAPNFTALLRVVARDDQGLSASDASDSPFAIFAAVTAVTSPDAPLEAALSRVWPNPARDQLDVEFAVAREAPVRLSLVDLQGRELSLLAAGDYRPGRYRVTARVQSATRDVPAGVYFIRYEVQGRVFTRRFALVR